MGPKVKRCNKVNVQNTRNSRFSSNNSFSWLYAYLNLVTSSAIHNSTASVYLFGSEGWERGVGFFSLKINEALEPATYRCT